MSERGRGSPVARPVGRRTGAGAGGPGAPARAAGRGRARTPAEIASTLRSLMLIGLGVHGVGILGTCLAIGIALRFPDDKLPVGQKVAFPLLFLVVVLGTYVCFASVHGAALYLAVRRRDPFRGLTMMAFGGGVLALAVIVGGFYTFGERFFLLGAAAAYAVPYCLGPLIVGLPTTLAAAYMSFRHRSAPRAGGRQAPQRPMLLR